MPPPDYVPKLVTFPESLRLSATFIRTNFYTGVLDETFLEVIAKKLETAAEVIDRLAKA